MILFGLCIGALICYLGGLMAVDIAPKKASGAALGVVGIASYIGAGVQDMLSGHLISGGKTITDGLAVYDFSTVRYFWIGAAAMSFLLCASLWKAKNKTKASYKQKNVSLH
jgi:OPA family sugar phosphate sensor protein UhpC-like MFS transporter